MYSTIVPTAHTKASVFRARHHGQRKEHVVKQCVVHYFHAPIDFLVSETLPSVVVVAAEKSIYSSAKSFR